MNPDDCPGDPLYEMIGRHCALWLLWVALHPVVLAAQDPVYQEQVEVEWILVPAVVTGPTGSIRGLEERDFTLSVDGASVAIESFEAATDAPVSLVHLQDLSGSMALGDKLATSRDALSCILAQARPGDEIALASFASGRIQVEVPFTNELLAVHEAMVTWRGYGTTALHDAVAWVPDIAVRDHGVKRAALLMTDGVDNASVLDPSDARALLRRAQIPVYVLGLGSGSPFELGSDGRKLHRYADVLNLLAHLTGGRYRSITGRHQIAAACGAILDDLRSQYILGFSTRAGGGRSYRSLKVDVRDRDVTVLHRRGYSGRLPAQVSHPSTP